MKIRDKKNDNSNKGVMCNKDNKEFWIQSKNRCKHSFLYIMLVYICLILAACNNRSTETKSESQAVENNDEAIATENSTDKNEIDNTNDIILEDETTDLDNSELNEVITDGQLVEKQHNIFEGVIGDEKIIMDIYVMEGKVTITYVGDDRTVENILVGSQKNTGILAKSEDNSIVLVLNTMDNGSAYGECYRDGLKEKINIHFEYITGGSKINQRYSMGEDVSFTELFAQDIIDAVNNQTYSYLYEHMQFPIKVTGKKTSMILNKEQLSKKKIFSNGLKKAFNESYSKLMYSTKEGIRIGNEKYYIWITLNKDNEWVITEVKN